MVCFRQTIVIQIFKGCLPQMLIGPFLKTPQMLPDSSETLE